MRNPDLLIFRMALAYVAFVAWLLVLGSMHG